jgi:ATP-dependent DNA helicase RecG
MSPLDQIFALINVGESETVEFKREMERPERLAREVVALANGRGGHVLVGVDDDGTLSGVAWRLGYEAWVMQVGAETIQPPLMLGCQTVEIEGKTVLAISVPLGPFKPYAVKQGQHKRTVYVRRGSVTAVASVEEVGRLYQESGQVRFDQSPVFGSAPEDLSKALLESYLRRVRGVGLADLGIPLNNWLLNLNALVRQNSEFLATVAGMLLFGEEPARFLPQVGLRLARFKGLELRNDRLIDRQETDKALPEAIDAATQFVARHSKLAARIEDVQREDIPEYLPPVVREAITNAVMHRDYARSANVRLFLFDDRLEIRSPGRLPNGVRLDLLPFGVQGVRNPTVAYFLRALRYGEGYGTGVATMLRRCEEAGIHPPLFQELGDDFCVTIYSRDYDQIHSVTD